MIARAYIKELKEQPTVKGSDPAAWKKLYRFLLKCKTFKATELVMITLFKIVLL